MPTVAQFASWPGAGAIESCSYTCSHGISPGVAVLVTLPRTDDENPPDEFGDLVIGDGTRSVRLKGCKVDSISPQRDGRGLSWTLVIFDRRWKWRTPKTGFGRVSGRYNLSDPRGKYVPWTIRSPKELAVLCLEQMGERGYEIDLPDGLTAADGAAFLDLLERGQQFPFEGKANPPTDWDATPPAEALARLCDLYGRRVVYQPGRDRVVVVPLGEGKGLPDGPVESAGASIDVPETPKRVGIMGAPIRYQCRLRLEAVGEEWDGSIVPIDELSYAPPGRDVGLPQVMRFGYTGPDTTTGNVTAIFTMPDGSTITVGSSTIGNTIADNLAELADAINANPALSAILVATVVTIGGTRTLVLTGRVAGEGGWSAVVGPAAADPAVTFAETTQLPNLPGWAAGWEYCGPPNYSAAQPTAELTWDQARERARRSVYRYYRIMAADPEESGALRLAPLALPGWGVITRRHQIVLQPTKVEQVVPQPRDPRGRTRGQHVGAGGIIPEYYDGYSRDQAAVVYGSVARSIGSVIWGADVLGNTDRDDKVYVPFTIVPEKQLIVFAEPVYANAPAGSHGARFRAPRLVLETAVLVMYPDTSALTRSEFTRDLRGKGPEEWQVREDVEVFYTATYDDRNRVTNVTRDETDGRYRVKYYLDALVAKYGVDGGETRTYIGILPIDPDGLVQQVSWSIGGGATTVASTNSEHADGVPPFHKRRLAEGLSADPAAAAQNLADRDPIGVIGASIGHLVRDVMPPGP